MHFYFPDEILLEYPDAILVLYKLDLSSFESIREFASVINETETKIDVLLHNAAAGAATFEYFSSHDSHELIMATNYFGPFLLTHLLIDLLKRSAPCRIVIVSSILYQAWPCNVENMQTKAFMPFFQYCKSKGADIRFTMELAKRLQGTGITVNCLHPGVISTNIYRNIKFPMTLCVSCLRYCMKSPEKGAICSLYCATSDELENVTGKYFIDCKETTLRKNFKDEDINAKFWETTKNIVLRQDDPVI